MMNEQLFDIYRYDISPLTMFHFKYSLRPFVLTRTPEDKLLFVDLDNAASYYWEDLEKHDLYFYTKEDDEDFAGVAIIGNIY